MERQLLEDAQAAGIRIIGPNCLGVMSPLSGLNATFATTIARPGSVGFISQSGALCTAVLDWSLKEMVGFSAFVSVGSMVDVGWGDLIYHLGNDPEDQVDRDLYGVDRQRPVVPFGGARSGPEQTDHRHQAGALRGGSQSGRFAYRLTDRQR